jgi:hypothetical protein
LPLAQSLTARALVPRVAVFRRCATFLHSSTICFRYLENTGKAIAAIASDASKLGNSKIEGSRMKNRIRSLSPLLETNSGEARKSRFEMIEPSMPNYFGSASPSQLHELAFLHARALVERTRWERLLRKIFDQDE